MTVDDLRIDQLGVITECLADNTALGRLSEMGLIPGATVRLVRRALFGGPLEVQVGQTHLALRRQLARAVLVDVRESGAQ